MSVNDQAAPAGDSPVTASVSEPMTVEAAAGIMAGWDDEPEDTGSPEPAKPEPEEAEPDDIETAAAESDEPEGEADEGEEPEQGEEEVEVPVATLDSIKGDTKIALRDGTVITGKELKERLDDYLNGTKLRQETERERAAFQQERSYLAQQARQFEQLAPQAIAAIQQSLPHIPDRPDPSLANTDPIRYVEERARYDAAVHDYQQKVGQIQQIQRVGQEQQQRLAHEQQQKVSQYVEGQREKLLEALPVLRDEGKRKEFYSDFLSFGKKIGFTEQELNGVYDARLMVAMAKAMAHDKLMSRGKPVPSPVPRDAAPRAPVAAPGRRVAGSETQAQQRAQLIARARQNGGNIRDIAAIVAEME